MNVLPQNKHFSVTWYNKDNRAARSRRLNIIKQKEMLLVYIKGGNIMCFSGCENKHNYFYLPEKVRKAADKQK